MRGWLPLGWLWLIVENAGPVVMGLPTMPLLDGAQKAHLIEAAPRLRLISLGAVLLVLRFSSKRRLPEK